MSIPLLFDWSAHVETIVVGGVLLLGFGVYAFVKGWPQQTIASLKDVTEADDKALARLRREHEAIKVECDGYKSDVARLLRETKIYMDSQEEDEVTIKGLREDVATRDRTIIELRRELTETLEKLDSRLRG